MITSPAVTVPLSKPSGSMIKTGLAALLLVTLTVGVTAKAADKGIVAVISVEVRVIAVVAPPLATVGVAMPVASGGVSVAVMLVVLLMIWAISTAPVWVSAGLDKGVGVSVSCTSGVSMSGAAVNSMATSVGETRPRSWAMMPVSPVDRKKASRSPNQPRPAPRMMSSRTAANGNRIMVANPRRSGASANSSIGVVGRHWLLCRKAVANSLALA